MRVGIISILQESNTFIQGKTTLQDFQNDILYYLYLNNLLLF